MTTGPYSQARAQSDHARMTGHDDIPATLGDLFRKGTVQSVTGARAVVKCGDIISPPLPWFTLAGGYSLFCAPTVGQQIAILCPDGDIAGGVIINGLFSDDFAAPGDGPKLVFKTPDGSILTYDPDAKKLSLALAGSLEITAPDGATLIADMDHQGTLHVTGDVTFDADVHVGGKLTADDDVVADGISLKSHKHTGVQSGGSQTGTPV